MKIFPEEREATLKMAQNPNTWPYPVLPVKKRKENDFPDTGIISIGDLYPIKIYVDVNLFMLPKTKEEWKKIENNPNNLTFNTVEEMLEAGWIVD